MIDRGFFKITDVIINDTEINMGQELSCNVSNFLMFHVILNGVIEVNWLNLSKFHVVYTNAVVSKGLAVDVTDRATHLEKLLIECNCFLEFSKVIIEHTGTVI